MSVTLRVDAHPLLEVTAFVSTLPRPLADLPSPGALIERLQLGAEAPLRADDQVRSDIRDLLRHGGYKPTGRGKPASEYLLRAAGGIEGIAATLGSINAVVDACNVVSLHSGLPISVVDLDRAVGPDFRVGLAEAGTTYVFNASGQTIDVGGLLCLFDAEGPCANAVKDSQRTKTHAATTRTLSIVWSHKKLTGRAERATGFYETLLRELGVRTERVPSAS